MSPDLRVTTLACRRVGLACRLVSRRAALRPDVRSKRTSREPCRWRPKGPLMAASVSISATSSGSTWTWSRAAEVLEWTRQETAFAAAPR